MSAAMRAAISTRFLVDAALVRLHLLQTVCETHHATHGRALHHAQLLEFVHKPPPVLG